MWIIAILVIELVMLIAWSVMDREHWKPDKRRTEPKAGAERDRNSSDPTHETQTSRLTREMKRTQHNSSGFLVGMLLAGSLTLPVMAQHQQHHQAAGKDTEKSETTTGQMHQMHQMHQGEHAMMGQGNMQDHMQAMHEMMSHPVMRTMMMTRVMPAMKEALDLSEDQVRKLDEVSESLRSERNELTAKIEEADKALRGELDNLSDADPDALGSLARKRASLVGDLQAVTLRSAMRMHGVLSADQKTKLASLDSEQMLRQMTPHMSEMDMMDTMQSTMMTGMNCPMMSHMGDMGHNPSTSGSH